MTHDPHVSSADLEEQACDEQAAAGQRPGPAPRDSSDSGNYFQGLCRQLFELARQPEPSARPTFSVGLTSTARREGVTSVAVNLAAAASHDIDGQVLLVDANYEAPQAGPAAGADDGPGLADLLLNHELTLQDCIQPSRLAALDVLGAGFSSARQERMVAADRVRNLIRQLEQRYQFVVFDLPVASELTACFAFARCLDGVILVIEAERTRTQAVTRAKKLLLQSGADVLGVVFNKRREHVPDWLYHRV